MKTNQGSNEKVGEWKRLGMTNTTSKRQGIHTSSVVMTILEGAIGGCSSVRDKVERGPVEKTV